ncbi:MAG: hypothetical protein MEEGG_02876 [Eggerthella lenta]
MPPKTPEDIRALYDAVVAGTLDPGDALDGQLFCADGVDVKASSQRIVHRGVQPESAIISYFNAMIRLVNSEEVPELYSALLSHYLFEYIHPFMTETGERADSCWRCT